MRIYSVKENYIGTAAVETDTQRYCYLYTRIINYLVKLCRHTVGGRVGVGFVQQGLDGRQDGGHVVGWRPPVLQDVQTNSTVRVHVRVKHFTDKSKNKKVYKPIFNPRHFYIFYGRFILLSWNFKTLVLSSKVPCWAQPPPFFLKELNWKFKGGSL